MLQETKILISVRPMWAKLVTHYTLTVLETSKMTTTMITTTTVMVKAMKFTTLKMTMFGSKPEHKILTYPPHKQMTLKK